MSDHLPEAENFLALPEEHCSPEASGVVVLQAPFEATSSYGHGSAAGPAAILEASHEVELFDAALGFEAYREYNGIATLPPMDVSGLDGAQVAERLEAEASRWLGQGKRVVTIGGEHTSVVGAIRAHANAFDELTVVQLDAHSDLRPEYLGDAWSHACAVSRILDFHQHVVQVGIRSQERGERETAEARGIPVFYAHAIQGAHDRREDWVRAIVDATSPNVYVTIDCDVMDPSIVPGTGTPEPGGLSWYQVDALLDRLCRWRKVVGFDVCELAPIEGQRHSEFTAAKLIYRLLGHMTGRHERQ